MIKEERQKYLMDLLSQYKFLKVRDIVNELKITDMTVRRDFQELEDKGLIIRVHGGARIIEDNKNDILTELSHREKQHIHLNEKLEIAKIIAKNIFEDETVFWVQVQPSNWSMSF
ncbi:DeoR family transcriptional regulator [Enterococcus faecium]|nr:DeoR family transcriptional regulator [Enterococcus faecium]